MELSCDKTMSVTIKCSFFFDGLARNFLLLPFINFSSVTVVKSDVLCENVKFHALFEHFQPN